jgi:hypothetical protein
MSILDNIGKNLDKDFENHAFLPQKLDLEDLDKGIYDFIKKLNITIIDETGNSRPVPIVFNSQELWAERRMNWKNMRSEYGEELTRPFLVLTRTAVKKGTSPLKRTIPVKKKFTWLKVPTFDGTLKGYVNYKIPQPTYVDISYELVFVSTFVDDINRYYSKMIRDAYSDGQGYMNVNGYPIATVMEDPSETREEDMASEKVYEVTFPVTVHGKLVDPTKFEKVNTINKIQIKISEKKSDR